MVNTQEVLVHVAGSKMTVPSSRPTINRLNNTLGYGNTAQTNRNNEHLDHEKPSES